MDEVIKSVAEKVLVLRFGRDEDLVCLQLDDIVSWVLFHLIVSMWALDFISTFPPRAGIVKYFYSSSHFFLHNCVHIQNSRLLDVLIIANHVFIKINFIKILVN